MANNKPVKLLPIKPFLPVYASPPRVPAPLRPELQNSPDYSPARVVPEALLRPSPRKNGLNMRGKGGSYEFQAPEEIARSKIRNTLNEENRQRAQSARTKLIFNPNFIDRYERGDPTAHQELANIGRRAAGERPLAPLPKPPPGPLKPIRLKPYRLENNIHEESPVTAPVASVPAPIAKAPPAPPNAPKTAKRPRNNTSNSKNNERQKRKTRRLKNRRHK